MPRIEPVRIIEESDSELTIEWSDGASSRFSAAELRRSCPCATCVDEWTGAKRLDAESIPDDLKITSTAVVGRYALNFEFSDGHDSGIFSYNYLRKLADGS
jgi:DUF971 family protein